MTIVLAHLHACLDKLEEQETNLLVWGTLVVFLVQMR